jgi:hypothetical protein
MRRTHSATKVGSGNPSSHFHRVLKVAEKQYKLLSVILIMIVTCNQYLFKKLVSCDSGKEGSKQDVSPKGFLMSYLLTRIGGFREICAENGYL